MEASRVPASPTDQANVRHLATWEEVAAQAIRELRLSQPPDLALLAFLDQNEHIILTNKKLELKSKWNEKCKEREGVSYSVEGKSPLTGKQASRHPASIGVPIAKELIMQYFRGEIQLSGYQRRKHERENAERQRDQALNERNQANGERDQARRERDQALNERNQARTERDQAKGERDQALNERNQALNERNQARTERDQANGERDQARHERDQALNQRNQARTERDQANEKIAALESQLAAAASAFGLDEDNADGEPNDRHADVTDRKAPRSQSATDEEQHQEDEAFLQGGASDSTA